MNQHLAHATTCQRQQGAALIFGMVILLVVTLVGITAMQGTTVQEKMAASVQFSEVAFQAAEDSVRTVTQEARSQRPPPAGNGNVLVDALNATNGNPVTRTAANGGLATTSNAVIAYTGATAAPGFSIGAGSGNFVFHRYRITANGAAGDNVATSTLIQELGRVGPSP